MISGVRVDPVPQVARSIPPIDQVSVTQNCLDSQSIKEDGFKGTGVDKLDCIILQYYANVFIPPEFNPSARLTYYSQLQNFLTDKLSAIGGLPFSNLSSTNAGIEAEVESKAISCIKAVSEINRLAEVFGFIPKEVEEGSLEVDLEFINARFFDRVINTFDRDLCIFFNHSFQNLTKIEEAGKVRDLLARNFQGFNQIKILRLVDVKLSLCPPEIRYLTGLTSLTLRNNELRYIPDALENLTQLEDLDLLNNKLKSLPSCIGRLTSLYYLQLQQNELEGIPESLNNLSHLESLDISKNNIKKDIRPIILTLFSNKLWKYQADSDNYVTDEVIQELSFLKGQHNVDVSIADIEEIRQRILAHNLRLPSRGGFCLNANTKKFNCCTLI